MDTQPTAAAASACLSVRCQELAHEVDIADPGLGFVDRLEVDGYPEAARPGASASRPNQPGIEGRRSLPDSRFSAKRAQAI